MIAFRKGREGIGLKKTDGKEREEGMVEATRRIQNKERKNK